MRFLLILLVVAPAVLLAYLLVRNAVNIYEWDEWQDDITGFLTRSMHGRLRFSELLTQHNESRYLIARLDFIALGRLFHGDARAAMAVSYVFACLACFLVYRLSLTTIPGDCRRLCLLALASLLIFSPVQSEAWLSGITHTFFFPVVFAMVAMLTVRSGLKLWLRFMIAAFLCLLSEYSYANGILTFGMVLPVLLIECRGWREAIITGGAWVALTVAAIGMYLHGYEKPSYHPSMYLPLSHPGQAAHYFLAFMGSPLGSQPLPMATLLGGVALALFFAACAYIFLFMRTVPIIRNATPWAMLGAYALGSDAFCTAGRLGFGVEQALASRYTVFSIYVTIAGLFLGAVCLEDILAHHRRFAIAAVVSACAIIVGLVALDVRNFIHGATQISDARALRLRAKSAADWVKIFKDDAALSIVWADPNMVALRARRLNNLGLYRPPLISSPDIHALTVAGRSGAAGFCEWFNENGSGGVSLGGWAVLPRRGRPADAVIFCSRTADGKESAFAMAAVGISRPDVGKVKGSSLELSGWRRTLAGNEIPPGTMAITAYAFDAERATATPLVCLVSTNVPVAIGAAAAPRKG